MPSIRSAGLVIAAGTYDGVLAGWELKEKGLKLTFATSVHSGSIRSVTMAASPDGDEPGALLSCGYDETLRTHDWHKRLTSSGEVRTPADFGTPVCSAFAPPSQQSTHCILGFSLGKICIYKKRDWSVQHVLAGHDGGVSSLAVHPSGKLALSGGVCDGKLKLWDLTKGRLAFVNKINPSSTLGSTTRFDAVDSIVWLNDGSCYALSYGSHVTVRDVASGNDLLDVDLPSRVNQVVLMSGPEGVFLVAACNDGSLPVLAVEKSEDENRRAIMAIEPVESHLAKEDRFKCLTCVRGYHVVTANSAGVVSVMNLEGAVEMIMAESEEEHDGEDDNPGGEGDDDGSGDDDSDLELAVDIEESIQLGTGARITCLTAWCKERVKPEVDQESIENVGPQDDHLQEQVGRSPNLQSKRQRNETDGNMDEAAIKKARSLVEQAKKLKKKTKRKNKKYSPSN